MKKRWTPFLLKLFLPGIIGLPWLLDLYFKFIPRAGEEPTLGYSELIPWLEPLAYAGFAFGVLAPMFLLKKYRKNHTLKLGIAWATLLAIGYILMVDPLGVRKADFFKDNWFIFVLASASAYLLFLYVDMSSKKPSRYLRLHFLFHVGVQATILMLCAIIFTEEFLKINLNSPDLLDESGTDMLIIGMLGMFAICATLAALTMCVASIQRFMKPEGLKVNLIEEIGKPVQ